MKDYTWVARETERHLDSSGRAKSVDTQAWETIILYGEPHRRIIEREGHPLPPAEQYRPVQLLLLVLVGACDARFRQHPGQQGRAIENAESRSEHE